MPGRQRPTSESPKTCRTLQISGFEHLFWTPSDSFLQLLMSDGLNADLAHHRMMLKAQKHASLPQILR